MSIRGVLGRHALELGSSHTDDRFKAHIVVFAFIRFAIQFGAFTKTPKNPRKPRTRTEPSLP